MDGLEATAEIRAARGRERAPHPDRRDDRPFPCRRPQAVPGRRNGWLRLEAGAARRAARRDRAGAPGARRRDPGRPEDDRHLDPNRIPDPAAKGVRSRHDPTGPRVPPPAPSASPSSPGASPATPSSSPSSSTRSPSSATSRSRRRRSIRASRAARARARWSNLGPAVAVRGAALGHGAARLQARRGRRSFPSPPSGRPTCCSSSLALVVLFALLAADRRHGLGGDERGRARSRCAPLYFAGLGDAPVRDRADRPLRSVRPAPGVARLPRPALHVRTRSRRPVSTQHMRHPLYVSWAIIFWVDAGDERRPPAVRASSPRRTWSWPCSSRSATWSRTSATPIAATRRPRPSTCRASAASARHPPCPRP